MDDTSTVTPSESPSSFSDLPKESWQEASANDTSGAGSQPAETPVTDATSAITPAGRDSATPSVTPREGADGVASSSGPIPFERHKEILEAERKSRTDLESKLARVAWAEELANAGRSAQQVREALELYDGLDSQPLDQFLAALYEQTSNHPQLSAAAKAFRERLIREAQEDAEPVPEWFEGTNPQTGQRERFLTAQSQREREAWLARQAAKREAPLKRDLESRAQREETLKTANEIYQREFKSMQADYDEVKALPHFQEIKADIKALMEGSGYKMSLFQAYTKAFNEKVLPTLSQRNKSEVLAELRTQANASGLKPSAPVSSTPGQSPRNFKDLPAEAWK